MRAARVVPGTLALLLVLVATPVTGLRVLGLDVDHPLAAVLAVFPWVVALAGLATVLALLGGWRRTAALAAVTGLAGVAVLAPRALPGPSPAVAPDGPELVVAVANLRVGEADPDAVVAAVADHEVDVLLTLELTTSAIDGLAAAGLDDLLPSQVLSPSRLTSGGGVHGRLPLTALEARDDRGFGQTPSASFEVPGAGTVALVGSHPLPPVNEDWTGRWRDALDALPAPAEGGTPLRLVAGDLNATLDHAPLRRLRSLGWVDAADAVGAGLRPTFHGLPWGEPVPPVTIDHVLVPEVVAVEQVDVLPLPDSDHRMLVVRLRLPAG